MECSLCKYWFPIKIGKRGVLVSSGTGNCKRYPPTVIAIDKGQWTQHYPITRASDICGEVQVEEPETETETEFASREEG